MIETRTKILKFIWSAAILLLVFYGCQKDSNETPGSKVEANGLTKEINAMVNKVTIDQIKALGMPVYTGENPPQLIVTSKANVPSYSFLISPLSLLSSTVTSDMVGAIFADYYGKFYNQNNENLTITLDYSSGPESGQGIGAFIVGEGKNFTVFAKTKSKISTCTADVIWMYSGTVVSGIIQNITITNLMHYDNGDACNVFMPNGKIRVFGEPVTSLATVTTAPASDISSNSFSCGGTVSDDGGDPVSSRGVCYGKTNNPTIAGTKTSEAAGTGAFTSSITGLTVNTTYYARAYATNIRGTAYGNTISFKTSPAQIVYGTMTDHQGNTYKTVKIGNQTWMAENLRATAYLDGLQIPSDANAFRSLTSGFQCTYKNETNPDSIRKYGRLYNWYSYNTGKLCPAGWHLPTKADFETLINYLADNGYSYDPTNKYVLPKALASKTDWKSNNNPLTLYSPGNNPSTNNTTGFSAYPAGFALSTLLVDHRYKGETTYFMGAAENNSISAWGLRLSYDNIGNDILTAPSKSTAVSVRFIKD